MYGKALDVQSQDVPAVKQLLDKRHFCSDQIINFELALPDIKFLLPRTQLQHLHPNGTS